MSRSLRTMFAVVIFLAVVPCAPAQADKVFRAWPAEAAEKFLQQSKIEFKKSSSKKGDEHYYDFVSAGFKVRLTHFSPQEVMLDCVFRGLPIEKVNAWNASTRFSRASYHKDSSGDFTLLEYSLDIGGGVTTGTIKQFVARFEDELKKYDKIVNVNVADDVILPQVTDDKIEHILKTQGINYTKKTNKAGVMMFDFELSTHKLRLYNFGGKDLMIDVHFRKVSLEEANRYNLNRKFVRVVNYKGKSVEYTALECNFDCEAGVTEGMIRHWLLSFGEDARHFAEFTKKLQTAGKN